LSSWVRRGGRRICFRLIAGCELPIAGFPSIARFPDYTITRLLDSPITQLLNFPTGSPLRITFMLFPMSYSGVASWRRRLRPLAAFALLAALAAAPRPLFAQAAAEDSASSDSGLNETSPWQAEAGPLNSTYSDAEAAAGSAGQSAVQGQAPTPSSRGFQGPQLLSSDRIIDILQQQPQLLATLKNAFIKQLKDGIASGKIQPQADPWSDLDPGEITDDAFFSRLQQDTDLRILVSRELIKRGYDEFGGPEADQGQPKPAAGTTYPGTTYPNAARPGRGQETAELRLPSRPQAGPQNRPVQPQEQPEPKMLERPSPYPSLPSLKDLYSQYPAAETKLRRFGSDTFRYGTGNAEDLPMDLPAGPDYVLGPGDSLVLNLWGSVSERLNRTIDRQGQIALPEAGPITVAGQSVKQAQEAMEKALSGQIRDIHVEISLARLRTVRVYVVGDVQRPGAYDISSLSTPLNALYAAGGPTSRGSLRTLRHFRGNQLVREIDLYDFLLHGVRSEVERLLPGDTLLVPPVGPQVTVSGMVRRPAIYELKGETGLQEVLDLAGGVLVSASLQQVNVERIEAHERRTMLSVRLGDQATATPAAAQNSATQSGAVVTPAALGSVQSQTTQSLPLTNAALRMQDGDRVLVSPILPYNEKAVYLQGHVFRPGKFAYRDGMTLTDLVHSYQDVMPEPADHAELIRLLPPDFRPSTIGFSLSDILRGDDSINLQPFDVIRIFGRYEIDAPHVSIRGEVLRPGEYPLSQGMTVAGLVRMAGGFKRSAYRETADYSSYVIQDGKKVLSDQRTVPIGQVLAGDRSADLALKPGDVVSIRQIARWQHIGASITLKGEVAHPGAYGVGDQEHLSSLLKRAGGFLDTAYPEAAVLQRVQVREQEEKDRAELIRRVETTDISRNVSPGASAQDSAAMMQTMREQRQEVLSALRSRPASGRLVIRISRDVSKWENTPADLEMRAGDVLVIPERPNHVLVSGQVYTPTAIGFSPGKPAEWYLRQAGGPTQQANKKDIFIVRANGSVVGRGEAMGGLWKEGVLSTRLQPGDSVVVPEKISVGSQTWRTVLGIAQLASSAAVTAAVIP
jgi:protein involved in polysaccharide export with SLBB domain